MFKLYVRPPVAITTSTRAFGRSRHPFPSITAQVTSTSRAGRLREAGDPCGLVAHGAAVLADFRLDYDRGRLCWQEKIRTGADAECLRRLHRPARPVREW